MSHDHHAPSSHAPNGRASSNSALWFHKSAGYNAAAAVRKRLLAELAKAKTHERRRRLIDRFLRSREVALYYAREGYSSAGLLKTTSAQQVVALSEELDVFSPCAEQVAVHREKIGSKV